MHFVFVDLSIAVHVVHFKGPFQFRLRISFGRNADSDYKLPF